MGRRGGLSVGLLTWVGKRGMFCDGEKGEEGEDEI